MDTYYANSNANSHALGNFAPKVKHGLWLWPRYSMGAAEAGFAEFPQFQGAHLRFRVPILIVNHPSPVTRRPVAPSPRCLNA